MGWPCTGTPIETSGDNKWNKNKYFMKEVEEEKEKLHGKLLYNELLGPHRRYGLEMIV